MMRPLSEVDANQAVRLIRQFFEYHSRCVSAPRDVPESEAATYREQWLSEGLTFGYEVDGELLGLIRFREDRGTYWIEDLIVRENRRRSGIGTTILEWAEECVKARGARSLFLDVVPANLPALDFFMGHGYSFLNTIELRKNFYEAPPKAEVSFLGRRFRIHSWPAERPLPRSGGGGVLRIRIIDPADRELVIRTATERWGSPVVVTRGRAHDVTALPGYIAEMDGEAAGLVTYNVGEGGCEIVSLDSFVENRGVGSRLLERVFEDAESAGCRRVWLMTTNDNTGAIRWYQKRGFSIAAIHLGAVKRSRELKPEIPEYGMDGIPILHEIEFEKVLP